MGTKSLGRNPVSVGQGFPCRKWESRTLTSTGLQGCRRSWEPGEATEWKVSVFGKWMSVSFSWHEKRKVKVEERGGLDYKNAIAALFSALSLHQPRERALLEQWKWHYLRFILTMLVHCFTSYKYKCCSCLWPCIWGLTSRIIYKDSMTNLHTWSCICTCLVPLFSSWPSWV